MKYKHLHRLFKDLPDLEALIKDRPGLDQLVEIAAGMGAIYAREEWLNDLQSTYAMVERDLYERTLDS